MLRVTDLKRSVEFYTKVMGMRVLRTVEQPEDKYSLTFLGFGDEEKTCVLELTYNYGVAKYEMGNAYGHIAIGVKDCYQNCSAIKARGGRIVRKAGPLTGSTEVIGFVADPDGYMIELVEYPIESI